MSTSSGTRFNAPAGLPAWLSPVHRTISGWVERLPVAPPSFALARALDRVLLPRLPGDARQALMGRHVELRVSDFGLRVRLRLARGGFAAAVDAGEPDLRIVAPLSSYLRLLRGEDDPDRLFFERALVMEGDTELGLVLKNTLDAIGPLWPRGASVASTQAFVTAGSIPAFVPCSRTRRHGLHGVGCERSTSPRHPGADPYRRNTAQRDRLAGSANDGKAASSVTTVPGSSAA